MVLPEENELNVLDEATLKDHWSTGKQRCRRIRDGIDGTIGRTRSVKRFLRNVIYRKKQNSTPT